MKSWLVARVRRTIPSAAALTRRTSSTASEASHESRRGGAVSGGNTASSRGVVVFIRSHGVYRRPQDSRIPRQRHAPGQRSYDEGGGGDSGRQTVPRGESSARH